MNQISKSSPMRKQMPILLLIFPIMDGLWGNSDPQLYFRNCCLVCIVSGGKLTSLTAGFILRLC